MSAAFWTPIAAPSPTISTYRKPATGGSPLSALGPGYSWTSVAAGCPGPQPRRAQAGHGLPERLLLVGCDGVGGPHQNWPVAAIGADEQFRFGPPHQAAVHVGDLLENDFPGLLLSRFTYDRSPQSGQGGVVVERGFCRCGQPDRRGYVRVFRGGLQDNGCRTCTGETADGLRYLLRRSDCSQAR